MVTTINPSQVLVNQTSFSLCISTVPGQPSSSYQALWSGERHPLAWPSEIPRGEASFTFRIDTCYEWSSPVKVNQVGRDTYLQWCGGDGEEGVRHIQVERYVDSESEICFVIFREEGIAIDEGKIENTAINYRDTFTGSFVEEKEMKRAVPTYIIDN